VLVLPLVPMVAELRLLTVDAAQTIHHALLQCQVRTGVHILSVCAGARVGEGECGMVRRLLQQSDLADAAHFKGQQVELFWPEDDTWWLARIIKVGDC
jgi:hypothetical protein